MDKCENCKIVREYLSKCREHGCDSCVAEIFCIKNNLRDNRYPGERCETNVAEYLKSIRELPYEGTDDH